MKEEIFKDHKAIEHQLSELKRKTDYIQEFVDKYNDLGIGKLEGIELTSLFHNSKEFVSKKITGGNKLKIKSLTVNPEKLLDIIEKPKGLEPLLAMIEKHNSSKHITDFYKIELYSIDADKVVVSKDAIFKIEEANTFYVENEKQKRIYEVASSIINDLNKLKTLLGGRLSLQNIEVDLIKRGPRNESQPTSEYADFVLNTNIIRHY